MAKKTIRQHYNTLTRDIYHFLFGIKDGRWSLDHFRQCKLCRRRFERWEKRQ